MAKQFLLASQGLHLLLKIAPPSLILVERNKDTRRNKWIKSVGGA